MKKFIIAAALVLSSTAALTSCTKENVKPSTSITPKTTADKSDVTQADINGDGSTTTSGS